MKLSFASASGTAAVALYTIARTPILALKQKFEELLREETTRVYHIASRDSFAPHSVLVRFLEPSFPFLTQYFIINPLPEGDLPLKFR